MRARSLARDRLISAIVEHARRRDAQCLPGSAEAPDNTAPAFRPAVIAEYLRTLGNDQSLEYLLSTHFPLVLARRVLSDGFLRFGFLAVAVYGQTFTVGTWTTRTGLVVGITSSTIGSAEASCLVQVWLRYGCSEDSCALLATPFDNTRAPALLLRFLTEGLFLPVNW
jgi:hypothetical protein